MSAQTANGASSGRLMDNRSGVGVGSGPVSAYDSFIGTLQGAASGKGIEFFRTESAPLSPRLIVRLIGRKTR